MSHNLIIYYDNHWSKFSLIWTTCLPIAAFSLLTCNFDVTCFAFSDLEITIILSLTFGFPPNLSKPECGPLSSTLFSASFLLCLFQSTRIMYSSLSPLEQEPSRFLPLSLPKWLNLYPEFSPIFNHQIFLSLAREHSLQMHDPSLPSSICVNDSICSHTLAPLPKQSGDI